MGLKKRPRVPHMGQGLRGERGWGPAFGGVLGGRGWQGGRQLVQGRGDQGGLESRSHKACAPRDLGSCNFLVLVPHN